MKTQSTTAQKNSERAAWDMDAVSHFGSQTRGGTGTT